MKILVNEKQLKTLIKNKEISEDDMGPDPQPKAGTSTNQTGGQGYPEVSKWESGVSRGPANQIGVTKWADVVGSSLKRDKANQLKEQTGIPMYDSNTAGKIASTSDHYLNPSNDTPTKDYLTFWGDTIKIPTDGSVTVYLWEDDKPRGLQFQNAYENDWGYIVWPRKIRDPKTNEVTTTEELAPSEDWLKSKFRTNTIKGIRTKKDNLFYTIILRRKIKTISNIYRQEQIKDDEWTVQNGYYAQIGDKYYIYKPENYIYTSVTTQTIEFLSEYWPIIGEVAASIVAGILTGGYSFVVQALVQVGVGATFATGIYLASDKTTEDKIGYGVALAISLLPFIPAATKWGVRGPLKSLTKYGDELANASTPEEVLKIINKFDEAEKIMIQRCFTQIPKAEFNKVIKDQALRGLAEQVRKGQVNISKIPAGQLKWWKDLIQQTAPVLPIMVAGYTYQSIEKRKEDEELLKSILKEMLEGKPINSESK
jgi:hypothetical protein